MKPIVLYSTRSGNTEKIAREIASELNCRCEKIGGNPDSATIDLGDSDLVFLGTGIYGKKPNPEMLNYLGHMNLDSSRVFALFVTWIGRGTSDKDVYDKVREAVEEKGQRLVQDYHSCLFEGHSPIARAIGRAIFPSAKGHPTAEDLSDAIKWAREIVRSVNSEYNHAE